MGKEVSEDDMHLNTTWWRDLRMHYLYPSLMQWEFSLSFYVDLDRNILLLQLQLAGKSPAANWIRIGENFGTGEAGDNDILNSLSLII